MGLDMYLTKTKRVKEFSTEDYAKVNNALPWEPEEYNWDKGLAELCPDLKSKGVEQLNDAVYIKGEKSSFQYITLKKEIGYWRKANQIHNWFVNECQDGVDECQLTEVHKEDLEELLEKCYSVAHKKANPEETLPTVGGFFFGNTDMDCPYYMEDIKSTIAILEKAIATTDWDKEIVFYQSSW